MTDRGWIAITWGGWETVADIEAAYSNMETPTSPCYCYPASISHCLPTSPCCYPASICNCLPTSPCYCYPASIAICHCLPSSPCCYPASSATVSQPPHVIATQPLYLPLSPNLPMLLPSLNLLPVLLPSLYLPLSPNFPISLYFLLFK